MVNFVISNSKEYKNIIPAEMILDDILKGNLPEKSLLKAIYPESQIDQIIALIDDMFGREQLDGLTPYKSVDPEENEIYKIKMWADNDPEINELYDSVQNWKMPDIKKLDSQFGKYKEIVFKNFKAFQDLERGRSCDNPYVVHLIGCGSVQGYFIVDKNLTENEIIEINQYNNALWGLHDSPEELIPRIKQSGNLKYGLEGIQTFFNDYIPEEMKKDIIGLNNIPKLVLNLLDEKGKIKNYSSFLKSLNRLKKKSHVNDIIEPLERMIDVTEKNAYELTGKKDFLEELKDIFYVNIYLQDLSNNRELFKQKGKVDLLDNLVGRYALALRSRRMSPKKVIEWAKIADTMVENGDDFKNEIRQMKNLANYAAKKIVIEDLAQPVIIRRYFHSAMNSLVNMKEALYENYAQPVNSTSPSK